MAMAPASWSSTTSRRRRRERTRVRPHRPCQARSRVLPPGRGRQRAALAAGQRTPPAPRSPLPIMFAAGGPRRCPRHRQLRRHPPPHKTPATSATTHSRRRGRPRCQCPPPPPAPLSAQALVDAAAVEKRFGVRPSQLADYLALCGDGSDNARAPHFNLLPTWQPHPATYPPSAEEATARRSRCRGSWEWGPRRRPCCCKSTRRSRACSKPRGR